MINELLAGIVWFVITLGVCAFISVCIRAIGGNR